jgi:hypothetical protein
MHNQHAGLSQALAEQRMTDRREQASRALGRGIAQPTRRRQSRAPRWEWQPVAAGSRPGCQASPPSHQPVTRTASVDRSGGNHAEANAA